MPDRALDSPRHHQCQFLAYDHRYLELVHPDTSHQRWVLRSMAADERGDDDPVLLQIVMFCPMCGFDGRKDARWQVPGRPQFNELVTAARESVEGWQAFRLEGPVYGDDGKISVESAIISGIRKTFRIKTR